MKRFQHFIRLFCVCALLCGSMACTPESVHSPDPSADAPNLQQLAAAALDHKNKTSASAAAQLDELALTTCKEDTLRSSNGTGLRVVNYTASVQQSFSPVWGKYLGAVPQGGSTTISETFELPAGSILSGGYPLGIPLSQKISLDLKGPDFNTPFPSLSMHHATHSAAIGVLSGTIVHESFDLAFSDPDTLSKHVSRCVIGSPVMTTHSLLLSDAYPHYYVGHISKDSYRDFSSLSNYKKHLESSNVMQAYNW